MDTIQLVSAPSTAGWLRAKLGGIVHAGREVPVNEDNTDPKQEYPQIVFSMNRGSPVRRRLGGFKAWDEETWSVKVITQGTGAVAARTIADEIQTRLDGITGEWAPLDGLIVSCMFDQPIRYPESGTTGPTYLHRGGWYKIKNRRQRQP